jgi:hypothetical protein
LPLYSHVSAFFTSGGIIVLIVFFDAVNSFHYEPLLTIPSADSWRMPPADERIASPKPGWPLEAGLARGIRF